MMTNKYYLLFSRYITNRSWSVDIFFLLVGLLCFYTLWLGSYPLFTPDEGRYAEVAREMVATGDYITPRVNGVAFFDKPILYYWLQAIAIHLFGIQEWALRLFPALLGIFGCLVTYTTGRLLFDRRTGFISAIILGTAPLYFGSAHYANLDLELAVFISSALLCMFTAIQNKTNKPAVFLYAAYVFTALAVLTKGLIGLVFPLMIFGLWILLLGRWDILKKIHLLRGILLFSAIVLPWYILVHQANPGFLHYFFVTQHVTRFLATATFNNEAATWFYIPIMIIGFFPWILFLFPSSLSSLKKIWKARHEHETVLFLLLWIAIVFIFFSIPRSKIVSYILPLFPALALLTGSYLSSIWQSLHAKRVSTYVAAFALTSILLAGLLLAAHHYHWIDYKLAFTPHLISMAVILSISAVVSFLFIREKKLLWLFATFAISSAALLLTLTAGASHLNQNSAKPLALHLKNIIQPQDEVIAYFKYYQDLPLYLGKRITIVAQWDSPSIPDNDNWIRELWYGMAFQKTDAWLINENTFWQRWNSGNRVYVLLNTNYLKQFKRRAKNYFHVANYNNILLLSNKPTILALARIRPEYP